MRGDTQAEDDYDLDVTVFTHKDGSPYYMQDGRKQYFEKAGRQINLKRWKKLRKVFKQIAGVPICKTSRQS